MAEIQLIINFGGYWEGSIYQGGDAEITLVDRNLRYEDLLSTMHEMVEVDRNSFVYEMRFLLNVFCRYRILFELYILFRVQSPDSIFSPIVVHVRTIQLRVLGYYCQGLYCYINYIMYLYIVPYICFIIFHIIYYCIIMYHISF